MSTSKLLYVFDLNHVLHEFSDTSDNANHIVKTINQTVKQSRSSPLKSVLDEIYEYDFDIPLDIIDLIKVYECGSITYHYAKTFQQHINNTVYITPLIFGYIETILFFCLFILPLIIETILTPLLIIYGLLLFIHAICALISYHKCSKYELFIRQFKQSLHSNDKFYEAHKDKYYNYKYENDTDNAQQLISTLSNPTNNTFAYIGYQRWLNVKKLELKNDKFTRSRSALCLSLSKYCIPACIAFSIIVFVHNSGIFASIWLVILVHLFNGIGYCYFRVAEGSNAQKILKWTIIYIIIQDIIVICIGIIVATAIEKDEEKTTFWVVDVVYPVMYGLLGIVFTLYLFSIVNNIFKYNKAVSGRYLWLIIFMSSLMWGVCFVVPSWSIYLIGILFFIVMTTAYYMAMQQLIERIMTGMTINDYVRYNIKKDPQAWLKSEMQFLFKPNSKLITCIN